MVTKDVDSTRAPAASEAAASARQETCASTPHRAYRNSATFRGRHGVRMPAELRSQSLASTLAWSQNGNGAPSLICSSTASPSETKRS